VNQSQRTAALVVRLAGFAMVVFGLIRLISFLFILIRVGDLAIFPTGGLWAAIFWLLAGGILLRAGRRIGEWLGRDLG
jgi:hypothetical protein